MKGGDIVNQDKLRKRTAEFIDTLKLPISRFSKVIGIERSTYYKWIKGEFDFGERRVSIVDEYLKRFGF